MVFFSLAYWDRFEKLSNELPSGDKFYSSLTNCSNGDNNCEDIRNSWKTFRVKIMQDCYDLFLKIYVLTLRCVFETFRKECGYNWGAMVRFIDVNFKLMWDIEKCQFVKLMIKDGRYFYDL